MNVTPKKVHWKDVQGNPYLQSLHPDMLSDQGLTIIKQDRTIGMSRYEEKIIVHILFDREYVIQSIIKKLLTRLMVTDYNQFQQLMSDVWKVYKANQKGES